MPAKKNPKSAPKSKGHVSSDVNDPLEQIAFSARKLEEGREPPDEKHFQPGRLGAQPEVELGSRVREAREARHMTQGDLAMLTASLDSDEKGISRAVISLYEKGTNRPSPRELRLLCEALQLTPNYLIYGVEEPFEGGAQYERLGTIARRSTPEGYAWTAYIMSEIHHNHYDAVMKLVLDLARGWDKSFDLGLQERANEKMLQMAE